MNGDAYMALSHQKLTALLQEAFPQAEITLKDLAGDSDHYAVTILSDQFEGLTRVQRHQLVYGALGQKMGNELHALSIQTLTPSERKS
jgi:stress-induced morphogen